MSAAIPYFKGHTDLENQMKILLDKLSAIERSSVSDVTMLMERESSAVRMELHLTELTFCYPKVQGPLPE